MRRHRFPVVNPTRDASRDGRRRIANQRPDGSCQWCVSGWRTGASSRHDRAMGRPPPTPPRDELQEIAAERQFLGTGLGAAVQARADAQFGVVSRDELVALGMSATSIARWTHIGRLQRIHPRVYAVGHRRLRREGWRMAALLTTGPSSHLTHWPGLAVMGLARDRSTVHVIPAGRRGTTARGIRIHRTVLHPDERWWFEGFPVTTVERAIADVAGEASDRQLGELLDDVLLRGLYDHRRMVLAIDRAFGRPGTERLAAKVRLLGDEGELLRSDTERKVRDRLRVAGLPRAIVNVPVDRGGGEHYELDLLWPSVRLNVEIDGPHHEMPHQRAADAKRDRWLAARGYRVVRFPVERVDHDFDRVVAEIAVLLQTLAKK